MEFNQENRKNIGEKKKFVSPLPIFFIHNDTHR